MSPIVRYTFYDDTKVLVAERIFHKLWSVWEISFLFVDFYIYCSTSGLVLQERGECKLISPFLYLEICNNLYTFCTQNVHKNVYLMVHIQKGAVLWEKR